MQENLSPGFCRIGPEQTIADLGGRGVGSALAYVGTRKIFHSETELRLHIGGKPGWRYVISITVNADCLYDIELWAMRGVNKKSLGTRGYVYAHELQETIESLYDQVMGDDGLLV
ncbi:MAG TPA: hypothetical protein VHX38_05130 [Pseudonocardiaceae bacterium]|jgi:hypothetical protein|nr:hypothetical protein [Pseudonocardiaceae bacterium]